METLQSVGEVVATIGLYLMGAILVLMAFAIAVRVGAITEAWLGLKKETIKKRLVELDSNPMVLAFGQSPLGKMVAQYLQDGMKLVDEPEDALIQAFMKLPMLHAAWKGGVMTPEDLSKAMSETLAMAIKLTDGIPDVEFRVKKEPAG